MKRLYVGCRVRILWSDRWPELAGQEGRVTGRAVITGGPNFGANGWLVAPDSWGTDFDSRIGVHFAPIYQQLEPIIPEGHQIVSWSECLWQHEGQPA